MPPPTPRRLRVALNHLTSGCAATTAPIASKANLKGTPPKGPGPAPVVFDKELPGCRGVDLSPEEIEHFKEHGWIVKKGLIDRAALAPIRDCIWPAAQVHMLAGLGRVLALHASCRPPVHLLHFF
jgi:hypothetical protein